MRDGIVHIHELDKVKKKLAKVEEELLKITPDKWELLAMESGMSTYTTDISIITEKLGDPICDLEVGRRPATYGTFSEKVLEESRKEAWHEDVVNNIACENQAMADAIFIANAPENVEKSLKALKRVAEITTDLLYSTEESRVEVGKKLLTALTELTKE